MLTERGLAATLYVTAGTSAGAASGWPRWGPDLPMLSPREIADLAADGCEIGAHSMTHPHLDCLPHAVATRRSAPARTCWNRCSARPSTPSPTRTATTAGPPRSSSSPPDTRSATAVRNALSHADDDRYAIARVTVTSDFGTADIARVLTGTGVPDGRPAGALADLGLAAGPPAGPSVGADGLGAVGDDRR